MIAERHDLQTFSRLTRARAELLHHAKSDRRMVRDHEPQTVTIEGNGDSRRQRHGRGLVLRVGGNRRLPKQFSGSERRSAGLETAPLSRQSDAPAFEQVGVRGGIPLSKEGFAVDERAAETSDEVVLRGADRGLYSRAECFWDHRDSR